MLLFTDCFDYYTTSELTKKWLARETVGGNNGPFISTSAVRNGTQGLRCGPSGGPPNLNETFGRLYSRIFLPGDNRFILGVSMKPTVASTWQDLTDSSSAYAPVRIQKSGSTQCWFRVNNSALTITAFRGTTSLGTTSDSLSTSSPKYVEFDVVVATGTGGSIDIYFDGVNVLTLSGINTANFGSSGWDQMIFGQLRMNSGVTARLDCDDLYLLDGVDSGITGLPLNVPLGDLKIKARYVTAEGTHVDSTPSTGTDRAALVDELLVDETDFNELGAVGDRDSFAHQDVDQAGYSILGMAFNIWAKKNGTGPAAIKPFFRIGGVNYDLVQKTVGTNFANVQILIPYDPTDPTSAWQNAVFDASEIGVVKSE